MPFCTPLATSSASVAAHHIETPSHHPREGAKGEEDTVVDVNYTGDVPRDRVNAFASASV
eukprot:5184376-Pleurochrysis_carterae.AAC.1